MKFATQSLSVAAALLAVTMFVTSAEAKSAKPSHPHSGTFVSASAGKMVMTGRNGKEHSHSVAKDCKVTIDGKGGSLAGLKKGMADSVPTNASGAVTAISTVAAKATTAAKVVTPATTPAKAAAPTTPATVPVKPASTGN